LVGLLWLQFTVVDTHTFVHTLVYTRLEDLVGLDLVYPTHVGSHTYTTFHTTHRLHYCTTLPHVYVGLTTHWFTGFWFGYIATHTHSSRTHEAHIFPIWLQFSFTFILLHHTVSSPQFSLDHTYVYVYTQLVGYVVTDVTLLFTAFTFGSVTHTVYHTAHTFTHTRWVHTARLHIQVTHGLHGYRLGSVTVTHTFVGWLRFTLPFGWFALRLI